MPFYKIVILFSISLICGGIGNICNGMDFRSDQLNEISKHISVEWPNCDSTFTIRYRNHDITVRTSDECVEHIGFYIFPQRLRFGIINPFIADFVERYWLSLTLPLKRQKTVKQQMLEDRFVFQTGSVESIGIIQQDTTMLFSCHVATNLVTMIWGSKEKPVCCITFPVNHELILGRGMIENDRRLPQEINDVRIKQRMVRSLDSTTSSLYADSLSTLWVAGAGSYLDCALKSERYYKLGSDGQSLEPVFDGDRLRESIVNLFTDYDIEKAENIRLSICLKTFGIKEQSVETTIPKFVAYCMQNGCAPFVGIVTMDKDNSGTADVLVIMHNQPIGYNHVLRVSLPLECILNGDGISSARLNAFVPSSNIKNLFKN